MTMTMDPTEITTERERRDPNSDEYRAEVRGRIALYESEILEAAIRGDFTRVEVEVNARRALMRGLGENVTERSR